MRLYLVRHGDAVSKDVDPERPLSETGCGQVQDVAVLLGRAGIRVSEIIHSGKRRAEETAEILAGAVKSERLVVAAGINPNDSTEEFSGAIDSWTDDRMVVGHDPFMSKMVSRLVAGDEDKSILKFYPAMVVCLRREETWLIDFVISPQLAGE